LIFKLDLRPLDFGDDLMSMKKSKMNLIQKYRKEFLVLSLGFSLVLAILVNLQAPRMKRELASAPEMTHIKKESLATSEAAKEVEEEQTLQSELLSQFKTNYSLLISTKNCLLSKTCEHLTVEGLDYEKSVLKALAGQIETLNPLLVSNWFRLNTKVKNEVISMMTLDDDVLKEKILNLLLELSNDEASAHVFTVIDELEANQEEALLPKTFQFIKKVSTQENELEIAKRLVQIVQSGDESFSKSLSGEINLILSPQTEEIFREALSRLPKSETETDSKADFLTSAL